MEDFIISIHKCISLGTSGTFNTSDLPEKGDRQKSAKISKNIHNLPVTSDQAFPARTESSITGVTKSPVFFFIFFNMHVEAPN